MFSLFLGFFSLFETIGGGLVAHATGVIALLFISVFVLIGRAKKLVFFDAVHTYRL